MQRYYCARKRHERRQTDHCGAGNTFEPCLPAEELTTPTGNHDQSSRHLAIPHWEPNSTEKFRHAKPHHGTDFERFNHRRSRRNKRFAASRMGSSQTWATLIHLEVNCKRFFIKMAKGNGPIWRRCPNRS